ncbi:glycosyltransferase [Aquiflexum sp.]|uniref:glycosyltransferase n=1 Tax=Aquiflexum sp. TaxID=1872584 RepID=UPI0035943E96
MDNPKNYLFVTIDGGGNIPPVIGLAKRLADNGHKVNVLTEPCMKDPVESMGLGFISFKRHFTRTDRKEDICKDWNAKPFEKPAFENIIFGPAKVVVEETITSLKANPTDVLVVDCLLPPVLIAGEYMNIPRVLLFHMPEYLPGPNRPPGVMGLLPGKGIMGKFRDKLLVKLFNKALNKYLPKINEIRLSYQLEPLKNLIDMLHEADRRFIQTSQAFDFPLIPAPENVRYTGAVLDDPDWVGEWNNPWPDHDLRPLVVVSLSSTFQNQAGTIQRCIDAIGQLDVRGLVTLGLAMENEVFDLPKNVKVIKSAPHSLVFPHADMVITHAGHGTIMRALSFGLPLICMPMGRDQNDNAAKVAYHGCGIKLSQKVDSNKIKKAIEKIFTDKKFRENAKILQSEINKDAAGDLAILELETIANKKFDTKEPALS